MERAAVDYIEMVADAPIGGAVVAVATDAQSAGTTGVCSRQGTQTIDDKGIVIGTDPVADGKASAA